MRSRASQKRYIRHEHGLSMKECPFCSVVEKDPREIHEETTYFYRIENIFGYDIWDGHAVSEHQMIVPKRHITSLVEMTDEEGLDYLKLIRAGESDGYCLYSRNAGGTTRSVAHVHTHLIKLDESQEIKQLLFVRKPHLTWYRRTRK